MMNPEQTFRLKFLSYLVLSSMCLPHAARADDTATATPAAASSGTAVNLTDVTVRSKSTKVSQQSDQTVDIIDHDQIESVGVMGGAAKALAISPGVSIDSYGSTGSSKTSITLNGIRTGWAGFSTSLDNGSISTTFDGVPMNNPGNGLWQSDLIPQNSMIRDIGVTYGPGDPSNRWFTNIGGGINFVPLQPTDKPGGEVEVGAGSFNSKNLSFSLQTGNVNDWETVIAGGAGRADSFRNAGDGFPNSERNHALYFKTKKLLDNGQWTIGAYDSYSGAWRPDPIPVSPNANTTMAGAQVPGAQLYSQPTSGFYSALPGTVNNKFDSNAIDMLWSQLDLTLNNNTELHNLTYFNREQRLHYTALHDYVPAAAQSTDPTLYENNTPTSYVLGDKLWTEINLPYNSITAGGYLQASRYHSIEELYNPQYTQGGLPGAYNNAQGKYFSDTFWQIDSALFVEDKISPISTVHITPGVRFVNYYTSFSHDEAAQFPNSVANNPGGNQSLYPSSTKTMSGVEPSLGVNWEASNHVALYTSFSRAYRLPEFGGGTGPFVQLDPANLQLEKGDYYQGGIRYHTPQLGSLQDVELGLSLYELKFSNETLATALASSGTLLAYGSSTYSGINAFTNFSPMEGTHVFANTGIVNAKFDSFSNSSGNFSNVPLAYTPHLTANIGTASNIFVGNLLIKPRIMYQYTGSQHIFDNSINKTSDIMLPAYGIVNAAAEFSLPDGTLMGKPNRLILTISVDNLLNHQYNAFEYVTAGGTLDPSTLGSVLALPAPSRMVFVSIGSKF